MDFWNLLYLSNMYCRMSDRVTQVMIFVFRPFIIILEMIFDFDHAF